MSASAMSRETPSALQWIGWLALLLIIPAVALVSDFTLAASATRQPVYVAMDLNTGRSFVTPIDYQSVCGHAMHTALYLCPILHALNSLVAILGPFGAVRAKLGRAWMWIIPGASTPATYLLCLLEQHALTHHAL